MIVTEMKPFGLLKSQINKNDKISIVSCNLCARMCGTGGEEGMKEVKDKLVEDGFEVVDEVVSGPICDKDLDERVLKLKGSVVICLACDAGLFNLKRIFKNKKVIQALDTKGLGAYDEEGNIYLVREFK